MARVNVPVTTLSRDGVAVGDGASEVAGDASNGMVMVNTGEEFLNVRNDGGSDRTITPHIAVTVDGQSVNNPVITVSANSSILLGPFPTDLYDQLSGDYQGKLTFDVAHADLKLMAFKVRD